MNDTIRDIVRSSHLDVYGLGKERYRWEYTVDKFSSMLIDECVSVLEKRFMGDLNREDMEVKRCIEAIRSHFKFDLE